MGKRTAPRSNSIRFRPIPYDSVAFGAPIPYYCHGSLGAFFIPSDGLEIRNSKNVQDFNLKLVSHLTESVRCETELDIEIVYFPCKGVPG